MYLPELIPEAPSTVLSFVNPNSTQYQPPGETYTLQAAFAVNEPLEPVTAYADSKHVREAANGHGFVVVTSEGGDDTVRRTIAAMIGHVQNDPEATAANAHIHSEILQRSLYVPAARGNANNFASALGPYAKHPEQLATADDLYTSKHFPLEYRVLDAGGAVLRTGIATSGIGLNDAAKIARLLEQKKPMLKRLPRPLRAAAEGIITLSGLWNATPFSAELYYDDGNPDVRPHTGMLTTTTGLELIGSSRYAKLGRTRVNIDDTYQQVVTTEHQPKRRKRAYALAKTLGRLAFGKHAQPPIDFTNSTLRIRITGDQPVPFHVDGDIGGDTEPDYMLQPGETIEITQSQLAVNVLMRSTRRSRRNRARLGLAA